jgi:hypothetical protein
VGRVLRPVNGEHNDGLGRMTSRVGDRLANVIDDERRAIPFTLIPVLWHARSLAMCSQIAVKNTMAEVRYD